MKVSTKTNREEGYALLSVVVVTGVLLLTAVAAMRMSQNEIRGTNREIAEKQAFFLADAAVQHALAQLEEDQATAPQASYTFSSSTYTLGNGTYSFTIVDDPTSSDPTHKRINATGVVDQNAARIHAHAKIRPGDDSPEPTQIPLPTGTVGPTSTPGGTPVPTGTPAGTATPTLTPTATVAPTATPTAGGSPSANVCDSLLSSYTDDAHIVSGVSAASTLFEGEIYGGDDVNIWSHTSASIDAAGAVWAEDEFESHVLTGNTLSTLAANLFREGAYEPEALHSHLIGVSRGIHFANGTDGHGVSTTVPERYSPFPFNRQRIEEIAGIVIIDGSTAPPFGTWNASTLTWEYPALTDALVAPHELEVLYYVKGNVEFGSVYLAGDSKLQFIADGHIHLKTLRLYAGAASLTLGSTVAVATPYGEAAMDIATVNSVSAGSEQTLHLIARDRVMIGWDIGATINSGTEATELTLELSGNSGVWLPSAGAGMNTTTNILAYSETEDAWIKTSVIDVLNDTMVNICAYDDATLAVDNTVASRIRRYRAKLF